MNCGVATRSTRFRLGRDSWADTSIIACGICVKALTEQTRAQTRTRTLALYSESQTHTKHLHSPRDRRRPTHAPPRDNTANTEVRADMTRDTSLAQESGKKVPKYAYDLIRCLPNSSALLSLTCDDGSCASPTAVGLWLALGAGFSRFTICMRASPRTVLCIL